MEIDGKILAIVPARGGSKGLPGKNILDCGGKPLLAWTIEAAQNSKYVDRVLVSTETQEIADIAVKYGAWVPFFKAQRSGPGRIAIGRCGKGYYR